MGEGLPPLATDLPGDRPRAVLHVLRGGGKALTGRTAARACLAACAAAGPNDDDSLKSLELLNQMHWLLDQKGQDAVLKETRKAEALTKRAGTRIATSAASLAPHDVKSN